MEDVETPLLYAQILPVMPVNLNYANSYCSMLKYMQQLCALYISRKEGYKTIHKKYSLSTSMDTLPN